MEKHILPVFAKVPITKITVSAIEDFLLSIPQKEKQNGKKLSNRTANYLLQNLRIILDEAIKDGILLKNPAQSIQPLHEKMKKKEY